MNWQGHILQGPIMKILCKLYSFRSYQAQTYQFHGIFVSIKLKELT